MQYDQIVELYNRVLDNDMSKYKIPEKAIEIGIRSMNEVYKPSKEKVSDRSVVANFNDVAHRCAYLHKYASLHTAMVRDLMFAAIRQNYDFFNRLLLSESPFKMCSLGGGPGSDVVGVLASLIETFSYRYDLHFSVTVLDYMEEWSKSFSSVIKELTSGWYGKFGPQSLQSRYLGANLLKPLEPEVKREISSSSMITLIKFISATNCKDTGSMVENIFSAMKPGAVIVFIDNAGGGFREFLLDSALKFNFIPVYGPIAHNNYFNEDLRVFRFGYSSCHKTSICGAVLQKPYEITPRSRITDPPYYEYSNCNPSAKLATPVSDNLLDPDEKKRDDGIPNNPLTPYVFQLFDNAFTPDPKSSALCSGKRRHPISTPGTPKRGRKEIPSKNSCIPLSKIKRWRHHLSTKLGSFKSRIQNKCGKKKCRKDEK